MHIFSSDSTVSSIPTDMFSLCECTSFGNSGAVLVFGVGDGPDKLRMAVAYILTEGTTDGARGASVGHIMITFKNVIGNYWD
jgi:hypothetical protein